MKPTIQNVIKHEIHNNSIFWGENWKNEYVVCYGNYQFPFYITEDKTKAERYYNKLIDKYV